MKKTMAIAAITVLLAACGGSETKTATTTDSTKVKQDTTSVKTDTVKPAPTKVAAHK